MLFMYAYPAMQGTALSKYYTEFYGEPVGNEPEQWYAKPYKHIVIEFDSNCHQPVAMQPVLLVVPFGLPA
jgi:hypothetical protein